MIQTSGIHRLDLLRAERSPASSGAASLGDSKGRRRISVALVYPNTYAIGMSSLGFQIAWRTICDCPGAKAERFFCDTLEFGSIESGRALETFDVIAFSVAYEMDAPNMLDVLERSGIPIEARNRTTQSNWRGGRVWPLILMGGVLVSVNHHPLYPFMDAFAHGDAEVILPTLMETLSREDVVDDPTERLQLIESLPGLEITAGAREAAGLDMPEKMIEAAEFRPDPSRRESNPIRVSPPPRVSLDDLTTTHCTTQILTPHTEFSDMALLDLARGCPHHCTFCWIGHNTPPYRQRSLDTLFDAALSWSGITDRFGLVASAVGAHSEIDEICRWMMKRNLKISYSSLRVEEVTPTMLEALAAGGQKTITIAPEAGNTRVRRLLGKSISDEQILGVVDRAMSLGIESIKQYYMIGVPSETDDEAMDIVRFTEKVREAMMKPSRARGRFGYVGVNLGVFVPKPNLPLNHVEPTPLATVKKRLKKIVQALNRIPNLRLAVSSPDLAVAQTTLSMGGIEASDYLFLLRDAGGDWREANRKWRGRESSLFDARKISSRISASNLRIRTTAAVAS